MPEAHTYQTRAQKAKKTVRYSLRSKAGVVGAPSPSVHAIMTKKGSAGGTNTQQKRRVEMGTVKKKKKSKYSKSEYAPVEVREVANSIRTQLAVKSGTLITYEEKLLILRVYSNLIVKKVVSSHSEAVKMTAKALQHSDKSVFPIIQEYKDNELDIFELGAHATSNRGTASDEYNYIHMQIQKEHLIWCHEKVLELLRDKDKMMSYAELHRKFEDNFDLKVTSEALRKRMMYDMDYCYGPIGRDTTSARIVLQTRQFLLKYSDILKDACVKNDDSAIAYMDETWVWRYHSLKKGIHKRGTRGGGPQSGKGNRLIVIDAITTDGALRHHKPADQHNEVNKSRNLTALWAYEYDKTGDYHDAFNAEKFQIWIEKYFIPTFRAKYPGKKCVLVLDNSSTHSTGMTNPFTTCKRECTKLIREWYDENNYVLHHTITAVRDGEIVEFDIPEEGNFAQFPRGPSKIEVQQTLFDLWAENDDKHLVTWVEEKFNGLGWTVIFTPPYMCDFQPIEKYWANIKGHICRSYFKGRNMQWIADEFQKQSVTVDVGALVRHAAGEMNTWIRNDDLLTGSINYEDSVSNCVDVKDNADYNRAEKRAEILQANPKYMNEAELEVANNAEANTVHISIVDTEEGADDIIE